MPSQALYLLELCTVYQSVFQCVQAIGKPHSLWTAFARLYERHGDVPNARIIFQKATEAPFKYVDDLATVWTEFVEMELRHKNFQRAMSLIKQATTTPANLSRRQVCCSLASHLRDAMSGAFF